MQQHSHLIGSVGRSLLNLFYLNTCLGCSSAPAEDLIDKPLCANCMSTLEGLRFHDLSDPCRCACCGELDPSLGLISSVCVFCRTLPTAIDSICSAFYYDGAAEVLIKRFKYAQQYRLGKFISRELADLTIGAESTEKKLIVPIPPRKEALRERGFHHLGVLARSLSRLLRCKMSFYALKFQHERSPQAGCKLSDRHQNTKGIFRADPRLVSGENILLVDDVLTSGATISEAAKALRASGAKTVDAITFARSTRFQINRSLAFRAYSELERQDGV